MVNGASEPCPTCSPIKSQYEPLGNDSVLDTDGYMVDPSGVPHPQTGLRPWEIDPAVAPTGIGDMVREAKGLGGNAIVHAPLGCARNLTATEMMERKRMAEKEQTRFFNENPELKRWVEYVKRCIEKGI